MSCFGLSKPNKVKKQVQDSKKPLDLFTPLKIGAIEVTNRILMAPLTRARTPSTIPGKMQQLYYQQRASAGLIVSEATNISPSASGWANVPGIWTDEQESGWKDVVEAVHAKGGRIALQLWHTGRVSHETLQPNGQKPVAPSAIQAESTNCYGPLDDGTFGNRPVSEPRALETNEIPGIIDDYKQAVRRTKRAGFDLVEIHSANGYLLHEFLATGTNKRTDKYGGSVENRARIVLEVVDAAIKEWSADRVGIRFSPYFVYQGMSDDETEKMYYYLAEELNKRKLAYIHINEPNLTGAAKTLTDEFRQGLRTRFTDGVIMYCGGYDADSARNLLKKGHGDAAVFGRPFIANPDLPERFRLNAPLNPPDFATFSALGPKGYIDYPFLKDPEF